MINTLNPIKWIVKTRSKKNKDISLLNVDGIFSTILWMYITEYFSQLESWTVCVRVVFTKNDRSGLGEVGIWDSKIEINN